MGSFAMSLTFSGTTAIDVTADNAVVNAMLCTISVELMVVNERVADSLGGTCGSPSPLATNSAPVVEEEEVVADDAADADADADAAAAETPAADANTDSVLTMTVLP